MEVDRFRSSCMHIVQVVLCFGSDKRVPRCNMEGGLAEHGRGKDEQEIGMIIADQNRIFVCPTYAYLHTCVRACVPFLCVAVRYGCVFVSACLHVCRSV